MNVNNYFEDQLISDLELNRVEAFRVAADKALAQNLLGRASGYGVGLSYGTGSAFPGGVVGAPVAVDSLVNINALKPERTASDTITVNAGSAIDASGSIVTLPNNIAVSLNQSTSEKLWEGTYDALHYIYLTSYLSGSIPRTDDSGTIFYTQYDLKPKVVVSYNNPGDSAILLGTFLADSNSAEVVSGSLVDRRKFVGSRTSADRVYIDPTDNPLSGSVETMHAHIKAVGSGTASVVNPHGMQVYDLHGGIFEKHLQQHHSNGIILQDSETVAYKASWQPQLTGTEYPAGTGQYIYIGFTTPIGATASIQGRYYTNSVAAGNWADVDPGEVHYVVLTPNAQKTEVVGAVLTSAQFRQSSKLRENILLGTVVAEDEGGVISYHTLQDLREIGATQATDLRVDLIEGTSSPTVAISPTGSLLTNLDRIRYQLGQIIGRAPEAWTGSVSWSLAELFNDVLKIQNSYGTHRQIFRIGDGMESYSQVYSDLAMHTSLETASASLGGTLRYRSDTTQFELLRPKGTSDYEYSPVRASSLTLVNNTNNQAITLSYTDLLALKALIGVE